METLPTGTVNVTIGRNVGREPLSAKRWKAYRDEVTEAVQTFVSGMDGGFVTVNGNTGKGFWVDEQGVRVDEDNAVWVAQYQRLFPRELEESDVVAIARRQHAAWMLLVDDVAHAAWRFNQDAFAITHGETQLYPGHQPAHVPDWDSDVEAILDGRAPPIETDGV